MHVRAGGGGGAVTASTDFGDAVMTGDEFRGRVHTAEGALDQGAFNALWPRLRVLARCSPQDKFTIIQGCQAYRLPGDRRDIVAMTGTSSHPQEQCLFYRPLDDLFPAAYRCFAPRLAESCCGWIYLKIASSCPKNCVFCYTDCRKQ